MENLNLNILGILQMLAAVYPNFRLTEEAIDAYTLMLSDLDASTLQAAAIECGSKNTFFPSVAELRKAAANLHKRSSRVPSSDEAWGELLNAPVDGMHRTITDEIDDEGRVIVEVRNHEFTHALIRQVAENLGWPKRFWSDNLVADRSRFMNSYEQAVGRGLDDYETVPAVRDYIDRLEMLQQDRAAAFDRGADEKALVWRTS